MGALRVGPTDLSSPQVENSLRCGRHAPQCGDCPPVAAPSGADRICDLHQPTRRIVDGFVLLGDALCIRAFGQREPAGSMEDHLDRRVFWRDGGQTNHGHRAGVGVGV